jgi:UDP-glucose 4-epimerase
MDAAYTGNPLQLYGCDWPTKDGSAIRDFISVNDISRAHFHAADYALSNRPAVHIFNMGTRNGITMLDLIRTFEDVIGTCVPYEVIGRRTGDPAILLCDPSKFIADTGFVYKDTLEDMLRSAWDWYVFKKGNLQNAV